VSPKGRPEGEHRSAKHEGSFSGNLSTSTDATILAFDFGLGRIGVAIGTTRLRTARALTTIDAEDNARRFAAIGALIDEWQPERLVVGLPLHADGTPHDMTARARRFARQLEGRYGIAVVAVDERYTTELARSALRDAGRGGREDRGLRDAVAAELILQAYLDTPHDGPPAA
jgi:putative Holliday junction resolvase